MGSDQDLKRDERGHLAEKKDKERKKWIRPRVLDNEELRFIAILMTLWSLKDLCLVKYNIGEDNIKENMKMLYLKVLYVKIINKLMKKIDMMNF